MSRETRIGILSIIVIATSIWGYKFIKGQNIFSSQQFFYINYDDVGQMQQSSPVFNLGYQIGTVTDIYREPDKYDKVVVEIEVIKKFKVPKEALAIINQSAMGDKSIHIEFNKACSGPDCAKSGDYLKGEYKSVLGSMTSPAEVKQYLDEVVNGLKDVTAKLDTMVNDPDNVIGKTMSDLQLTMANMKNLTSNLDKEMQRNGRVNNILANVQELSASIEKQRIQSILANADSISNKVNEIDMKAISDNTNKTMTEAQAAIAELSKTMEKADKAILEFNALLAGINQGEGSLGKLVKDDKLYDELKDAAEKANVLMLDIQQRPARYIPFKSRRKVRKIDEKNPLVLPIEETTKEEKNN
jgi:phospholipid/cholesterol/gamma-HCH transport system substrate-binding protein